MVIGIHKNSDNKNVNGGTFIGEIINEINNDIKTNNDNYIIGEIYIKDEEIERTFQGGFKVGHLIQTYRKERGISAAKLAEEIGCAQQTVYRWESGTRVPDIPTLMQIAKILGVNLDDLTR